MGYKTRTWTVLSLLGAALVCRQAAKAQQPDFSKVQIKVTKASGNIYMLEGQGGNIAASVGEGGTADYYFRARRDRALERRRHSRPALSLRPHRRRLHHLLPEKQRRAHGRRLRALRLPVH